MYFLNNTENKWEVNISNEKIGKAKENNSIESLYKLYLKQAAINKAHRISKPKREDPRQKRYSVQEKAAFIAYMNQREKNEDNRSNLSWYAERHGVSRETLYNLHSQFKTMFENEKPGPKVDERDQFVRKLQGELKKKNEQFESLQEIVRKLENKSQEQQERLIRTILQAAVSPASAKEIRDIVREAFGVTISKSKIKRLIAEYSMKAKQVLKDMGLEKFVEFLAVDEVFAGKKPVLTGVDLDSFAVVICEKKDSRDHEVWHSALSLFPHLKLVVSDKASGIQKAVYLCGKVREEIGHQFDLFHFKRDVGKFMRHLEAWAYRKIEAEYKAQENLNRTKSEETRDRLRQEYVECKEKTSRDVEVFDQVEKNFAVIYNALDIFDCAGALNEIGKSLKQIDRSCAMLEKISTLWEHEKDRKTVMNLVKQTRDPHLLLYLRNLQNRLLNILIRWNPGTQAMPRIKAIGVLAEYWYWLQREKTENLQLKECWKQIASLLQVHLLRMSMANFDDIFKEVSDILNTAFRASSLVESFNSQIRICQQVKKGLHKDFLYLVALNWNMTPFEEGKRKSKSPCQILGVPLTHTNWLDLLRTS